MYPHMFRKIAKRPILRAQLDTQAAVSGKWMPATFFDGPPSPMTRRWIRLIAPVASGLPGPDSIPLPALGQTYSAKLVKNFGASSQDVFAVTRTIPMPGGGSRIEAKVIMGA